MQVNLFAVPAIDYSVRSASSAPVWLGERRADPGLQWSSLENPLQLGWSCMWITSEVERKADCKGNTTLLGIVVRAQVQV